MTDQRGGCRKTTLDPSLDATLLFALVRSFKDWLFSFEQYCEITGLTSNYVDMACYAVTLFEKAALTWWQVTSKSQS